MPTGEIPQSNALAEADSGSLTEYFSRDPEDLTELDFMKLIGGLRAMRPKWAAGEQEKTKDKADGTKRAKAKEILGSVPQSLEDCGL